MDFLDFDRTKSPAVLSERQTQRIKACTNGDHKNDRNDHGDHAWNVFSCHSDDQPCSWQRQNYGDDVDIRRRPLVWVHGKSV